MNKIKLKKISRITANIILYVFLVLCVAFVVYALISSKSGDGATEIFGHQMRVVTTESMEKCDETDVSRYDIGSIPVNSMVFIEAVPTEKADADKWYASLKEGDVLTFKYVYNKQITVTHRIVSIKGNGTGGYIIALAGDNKNADASQLYQVINTSESNSGNYVIGKVVGQSRVLGATVSFMQNPVGMIAVIIVPCVLIIFIEILRIFKMAGEKKRVQAQLESEKKDEELEMLRRRLAEIEGSASDDTPEND